MDWRHEQQWILPDSWVETMPMPECAVLTVAPTGQPPDYNVSSGVEPVLLPLCSASLSGEHLTSTLVIR